MTVQEKNVRNLLIWLRDNDHHITSWWPLKARTEARTFARSDGSIGTYYEPMWTHFIFSGYGNYKAISAGTQELCRDFVKGAPRGSRKMFEPNEMGMKIANGEIEGGFLNNG